jgi:hypothetical protein
LKDSGDNPTFAPKALSWAWRDRAAGLSIGRAQRKSALNQTFLAQGGFMRRIPAITDFRAKGTIMGLAVLTAVFGMGTGVTPPVWSPEMYPAGGQARPGTGFPSWSHSEHKPCRE